MLLHVILSLCFMVQGEAIGSTRAEVSVSATGAFRIDLHADFDGLLLGSGPGGSLGPRLEAMERFRALDSELQAAAVERLEEFLKRRVRARFDGRPETFSVSFPQRRQIGTGVLTLGSTARLSGQVPTGAARFQFFASRSFRSVDLRLVSATGEERLRFLLQPGEESPEVDLRELGYRQDRL